MQTLSACWTSGGGDLSAGTVAKFFLIFSDVPRGLLLEETSAGQELAVVERFSTPGDRVCQEVSVPVYDVTLYYGVVAVDKAGNKGAMSNIVRLTVASARELQTESQVRP